MSDPEIDSSEVNDDCIQGIVKLTKTCAECGTELAEAYPEFEIVIEDEEDHKKEDSCDWSIESEEAESNERGEGRGRYMKTFYGADLTFNLVCSCGYEQEVTGTAEEQASYFDELV
jgi:hypothetical protein